MPAPKGNQYAKGCTTSGRPKKYSNPAEMQKIIDSYFDECNKRTVQTVDKKNGDVITVLKQKPYTIEGLALALGFTTREALLYYEKEAGYEEFFDTIKKAKLKILENKLIMGLDGIANPAITIFDLKNNHNFKEKTETDITSGGDKIQMPQIYLPDNGRSKK